MGLSSVYSPLQLLNAIQLFGANLDDYLHLLLPPIVKLFDAPDVPLQARKSVLHMAVQLKYILTGIHYKLLLLNLTSVVCIVAAQK